MAVLLGVALGAGALAACSHTIEPPTPTAPVINAGSLPDGTVNRSYVAQVTATGGQGHLTFKVTAGNLPDGLAMDVDGKINGIPTKAGGFTFTASAEDEAKKQGRGQFTITIKAAALKVTTESLPDAVQGVPYQAALMAEGGTPPYSWTLINSTVPGLAVGPDGQVGGTPGTATQGTLTVEVTDSASATARADVPLQVLQPLRIITTMLPPAQLGMPYNASLQAQGGVPPYTFTVPTGLPDGITVASDGTLSGTPTRRGTFTLMVKVTSMAGDAATASLDLRVVGGLEVTTPSVTPMAVGVSTDQQLTAAGGMAPYQWQAIMGQPPAGVVLDEEGHVTGTPTATGCTHVTYQVTDAQGNMVTRDLTFSVGNLVQVGEDFTQSPMPIPDNGGSGVVRNLSQDTAFQVLWATLQVDLTHPSRGDVAIRVISPAGESVRQKRSDTYDMGADLATSYDDKTRGFEPLSTFVGTQAQGMWQLRVFDLKQGQSGFLNRWTLNLITDECNEPYIRLGPRAIQGLDGQPHNLFDYPFAHITGGGIDMGQIQYSVDVCDPGPDGKRNAGGGDDTCHAMMIGEEVLWFTDLLPSCLATRQDMFQPPCSIDEAGMMDPANIATLDTLGLLQTGYATGFGAIHAVFGGQRWSLPVKVSPPNWLVQCLHGSDCPDSMICCDTGVRLTGNTALGTCAPAGACGGL
jgi:subtilisin-like proprotein convertase family protein